MWKNAPLTIAIASDLLTGMTAQAETLDTRVGKWVGWVEERNPARTSDMHSA